MKETKSFEEAFKEYNLETRAYNSIFPKILIGSKIVDLLYGPDHDGDACLYYIVLDNGVKIGISICEEIVNEVGTPVVDVKELDKTKHLKDGSFIRFQFHDWPEDFQKLIDEYKEEAKE